MNNTIILYQYTFVLLLLRSVYYCVIDILLLIRLIRSRTIDLLRKPATYAHRYYSIRNRCNHSCANSKWEVRRVENPPLLMIVSLLLKRVRINNEKQRSNMKIHGNVMTTVIYS